VWGGRGGSQAPTAGKEGEGGGAEIVLLNGGPKGVLGILYLLYQRDVKRRDYEMERDSQESSPYIGRSRKKKSSIYPVAYGLSEGEV